MNRKGFLPPLLATLPLALLVGPIFAPGSTFAWRDLSRWFRPARRALVMLARDGFPGWNPWWNFGQPFAANPQAAVFHPTSALFLVLPFEIAWRLMFALPLLLAAVGGWQLAKALGGSTGSRVLSAVLWSCGGAAVSAAGFPPILFAWSATPLLLAGAVRLSRSASARALAVVAASFALAALAGEPAAILIAGVLALLLAASTGAWRGALRVLGGLLLGAGLSAVSLLPAASLGRDSVRTRLSRTDAAAWSTPALRLPELVIPHWFGAPVATPETPYWGGDTYPKWRFPLLPTTFVGIVAVACALAATRSRRGAIAVAAAAAGAALACARSIPLWDLVSRVPPLSLIRSPEKFLLLAGAGLALAAPAGLDAILGSRSGRRRGAIACAAAALLLFVSAFVVPGLVVPASPDAAAASRALTVSIATSALFAAALAGLLRVRMPRRVAALLIATLAGAELVLGNRAALPTEPVAALDRPPACLAPVAGSGRLLFDATVHDPSVRGFREAADPPVPTAFGIRTALAPDYDLSEPRWTFDADAAVARVIGEATPASAALLARRGISVVRVPKRPLPENPAGDPHRLVGVPAPAPDVFCADRVFPLVREEDYVATLRSLGPESSRTVVLDAADAPTAISPCEVAPVVLAPGRLAFDVRSAGPADSLLAPTLTWHRGWSAEIDGAAAKILRADVSLSALRIPPGTHRVELRYRQPGLFAGAAISAVSAPLLIGLLLAERRK